jgi:hypothetical protein
VIRRIELGNFMSHARTDIEPADAPIAQIWQDSWRLTNGHPRLEPVFSSPPSDTPLDEIFGGPCWDGSRPAYNDAGTAPRSIP